MCLDLRGSQYYNIEEVETLLEYGKPEEYITSIKDNRKLIEKNLRIIHGFQDLEDLGY